MDPGLETPWIAVFRRAARQHGAVTRAQAVYLGWVSGAGRRSGCAARVASMARNA